MKRWIISVLLFSVCTGFVFPETKTIMYINSYHAGYPSSDQVRLAIIDGVKKSGDSLITVFMDCKRNTSAQYGRLKADSIMQQINRLKPDGIIVSDDDAVKYVIQPYLINSSYPVVFCGVNWDCSQYGLPAKNVTGVLEVLPLAELLGTVKKMKPNMKKIAVLSENTVSEQNNKQILDTLYRRCGFMPDYILVDNFEQWKSEFVKLNKQYDVIYMPTNGAIKNWDKDQAKAFVLKHTKKLTITCDDFMMPYCAFGLTKVAYEQGQLAMDMMQKNLCKGIEPGKLAVQRNVLHTSWKNAALSKKIGLKKTIFDDMKPKIVNK